MAVRCLVSDVVFIPLCSGGTAEAVDCYGWIEGWGGGGGDGADRSQGHWLVRSGFQWLVAGFGSKSASTTYFFLIRATVLNSSLFFQPTKLSLGV